MTNTLLGDRSKKPEIMAAKDAKEHKGAVAGRIRRDAAAFCSIDELFFVLPRVLWW